MKNCIICNKKLIKRQKQTCSWICRGKAHGLWMNKNHPNLGKHLRKETRIKIGIKNSVSLVGKHCSLKTEFKKGHPKPINGYSFGCGEENFRWKGGTYGTERHKDMGRSEYKTWRRSVFERDDYTCVWCGKRGGRLNADHIKLWTLYPNLRYEIDNGRTLCVPCHGMRSLFDKIMMIFYQGLSLQFATI